MGDSAKAEPLCRQALAIKRKVLGENHRDTATSLNNLAELYVAKGDYAKAEPLFRQVLDIHQKVLGENHPRTATSLNNLAGLYRSLGDDAKAEPLSRQVLESSQRLLVNTFGILSEREQLSFEANLRCNLDFYLSLAGTAESRAAAGTKPANDADVYRYLLLGKGIVTAQQEFIHLKLRRPELGPCFRSWLRTGSGCRACGSLPPPIQRGTRPGAARSPGSKRTAITTRSSWLRKAANSARSKSRCRRTAPRWTNSKRPCLPKRPWSTCSNTRTSAQPPRSKVPSFASDGWSRLSSAPMAPCSELSLVPQPRSGRRSRSGGASPPSRKNRASNGWEQLHALRSLVWNKLEPHLAGVETLLISPDGPLCRFPLAALPGTKPDTYLIEERPLAIVVVPVPQLLSGLLGSKKPDNPAAGKESMLLVGDVAYDAPAGDSRGVNLSAVRGAFSRLPELEHSRAEILAIKDSFERRFKPSGSALELRGEEATEAAFRREVAEISLVAPGDARLLRSAELEVGLGLLRARPGTTAVDRRVGDGNSRGLVRPRPAIGNRFGRRKQAIAAGRGRRNSDGLGNLGAGSGRRGAGGPVGLRHGLGRDSRRRRRVGSAAHLPGGRCQERRGEPLGSSRSGHEPVDGAVLSELVGPGRR